MRCLQKGSGRGGGGCGYNIQKNNGCDTINGVNITDHTHEFSKDEWYKLPCKLKDDLNHMPERREMNKKLQSCSRQDRTSSATSTHVTLSDETQSQLITTGAAIIAVLSVVQDSDNGGPLQTVTAQQPCMGAGGAACRN